MCGLHELVLYMWYAWTQQRNVLYQMFKKEPWFVSANFANIFLISSIRLLIRWIATIIMEVCECCRVKQNDTNIHETGYGSPCCSSCADVCVSCDEWYYPLDTRQHNNKIYCIECLKTKLDLWRVRTLQIFSDFIKYILYTVVHTMISWQKLVVTSVQRHG